MRPQRPKVLPMFLAKITRNLSFDRFNAQNTEKRGGEIIFGLDELAECLASGANVEAEYESKELKQYIRCFVRALPERDGNIFVRQYFFTEPVSVIAERYALTENNVVVILGRIRKKFTLTLKKESYL